MQAVVSRNKTGRKRNAPPRRQLGKTGMAVGSYVEDAASLGVRTMRGLNELRKLINIETKVSNFNGSTLVPTATAVVSCLSQIAQGTDYTSRVGDSIRIQDLTVYASFQVSTLAAQATLVRFLIIRDLDGYGTAPTIADVFDAGLTANNVLAQYNFLNSDRFSVLFDELFMLDVNDTPTGVVSFHTTHQGHVKYLGSTAATTSNGKGSVYAVAVSNQATNKPTYEINSRLRFTDD